jgi:AcrR family transcriptional regulator
MVRSAKGRASIDAAAVRIIGEKGFALATTQEIAKAAGVSEGLIFRHYKTKLDLGVSLFRKHYQDVLDRLKETGAKHDDPLQRLRAVGVDTYRWFDENPDTARFLIKTHHEFMDKDDGSKGLIFLAGTVLKQLIGEQLCFLLPVDIISAMIVGAFLQVAIECTHGQVNGPLAPRMEPIFDLMIGRLAQVLPSAKKEPSDSM